jgi:hypothetical protein
MHAQHGSGVVHGTSGVGNVQGHTAIKGMVVTHVTKYCHQVLEPVSQVCPPSAATAPDTMCVLLQPLLLQLMRLHVCIAPLQW